MSLCVSCGVMNPDGVEVCPHHHNVYGDDWAASNRVWCDFFHRGIVPKRLTVAERDDDFWYHAGVPDVDAA